MSAISGISSGIQPTVFNAAALQKSGAASPFQMKDSDGDNDGTRPGQVDPRDFGKGKVIDITA